VNDRQSLRSQIREGGQHVVPKLQNSFSSSREVAKCTKDYITEKRDPFKDPFQLLEPQSQPKMRTSDDPVQGI